MRIEIYDGCTTSGGLHIGLQTKDDVLGDNVRVDVWTIDSDLRRIHRDQFI